MGNSDTVQNSTIYNLALAYAGPAGDAVSSGTAKTTITSGAKTVSSGTKTLVSNVKPTTTTTSTKTSGGVQTAPTGTTSCKDGETPVTSYNSLGVGTTTCETLNFLLI